MTGDCVQGHGETPTPYAFIQYKGTDLCADFHCVCGAHLHADADFLYAIQCPHCERMYEMPSDVALIEVKEPCDWHAPKLLDPECGTCSSSPCDHIGAWYEAGQPQGIGFGWEEKLTPNPERCGESFFGDVRCDRALRHPGMHQSHHEYGWAAWTS